MKKGDLLWLMVLCAIFAIIIAPMTHQIFIGMTVVHPYAMGFVKFATLATMGELLAIRISSGNWSSTLGMPYKTIIWGVIGMLIVLMFGIFSSGVAGAVKAGLLYAGNGTLGFVLNAFFISAIMNLTFGPCFMAAHRIIDTYIDMRQQGLNPTWDTVVAQIDWQGFIRFVIVKTIPFFWIPAHTITFLMPPEYRVFVAALLSVALGAILAHARRKQA